MTGTKDYSYVYSMLREKYFSAFGRTNDVQRYVNR